MFVFSTEKVTKHNYATLYSLMLANKVYLERPLNLKAECLEYKSTLNFVPRHCHLGLLSNISKFSCAAHDIELHCPLKIASKV